jgi:hypothetical protein
MNANALRRRLFCLPLLLLFAYAAWGDDSAAAIAAGGLVPRRETRIVMAKEVLRISETKVLVDYDFRNDSDQDVTTEVAFPVPPYQNDWDEQNVTAQSFADFRLQIDGNPASFQSEAKAVFKGKDVTKILTAHKIDVASFGHYEDFPGSSGGHRFKDLDRLPKTEQKQLGVLGLFDIEEEAGSANWTVHLQYHWQQTFPAHSVVHIRHEYTPVVGFTQVNAGGVDEFSNQKSTGGKEKDNSESIKLLADFCVDTSFLDTIASRLHTSERTAKTFDEKLGAGTAYPHWVDFILTTANTWQRPIEDFTLIIERGNPETRQMQELISFCSPQNAKVEKLDADHFQVHLSNFVPAAELHIGFFDVPVSNPVQKK